MSEREQNEVRVRTQEEVDRAVQQLPGWKRAIWNITPKPLQRIAAGQQPLSIAPPSEGAAGLRRDAPSIYAGLTDFPRQSLNVVGGALDYIMGRDPTIRLGDQFFGSPHRLPGRERVVPQEIVDEPVIGQTIAEEPAAQTFEDFMSGYQFDSTPYDNYMNFLMQQDEETMARINAMYRELASEAEANMQRVADVYDSARIQSGDVFGGSAQNIEDAYSSASQQAADQMARLGIEAAAPAVLDPMALSQAEAVSGIERAGAGSLDALTRYGASAQDFGGQMAQVGQQQGLEVSSQILRDMAQRQAEAAFMREQARADFNPYARAMQEMELRQMMGAGDREMAEYIMRAEQLAYDRTMSQQERLNDMVQFILRTNAQTNPRNPLDWSDAVEAAQAILASVEQAYPYQF